MARISSAERLSRSLPCIIHGASSLDSFYNISVGNLYDTAAAQFDALWYFDCVVSPRSPSSRPSKPFDSPSGCRRSSTNLTATAKSTAITSSNSSFKTTAQIVSANKFLQTVFSTFDENGDGSVSVTEICSILGRLGMPTSEQSIQSFLGGLLSKTRTHVKEHEFLELYESVCHYLETHDANSSSSSFPQYSEDQDLLHVFRVFDRDGNGFITPEELQIVLSSLGFPEAAQIDACVDMIARVDENGDGRIDFVEFKKLFSPEGSDHPKPFVQTL